MTNAIKVILTVGFLLNITLNKVLGQSITQLSINGVNITLNRSSISDSVNHDFPFKQRVDVKKIKDGLYHIRVTIEPKEACSPGCIDLPILIDLKNKDEMEKIKKSFHWISNIKKAPDEIIAQHVFRSPCLILTLIKKSVAFIPDIHTISNNAPAPYYYDLHFDEKNIRINYGISNYSVVRHQYYKKANQVFPLSGKVDLAFYILVSPGVDPLTTLKATNHFLWKYFASTYTKSILPQTVTYKEYAKVGYNMALKNYWVNGPSEHQGGITLSTYYDENTKKYGGRYYKDDLWYHSWFNNIRTAYGLFYWGKESNNEDWQTKAISCVNLILSSPNDKGWFPTIYNSVKDDWVSSGQGGGKGLYHMPDNAWTALWVMRFNDEMHKVPGAEKFIYEFSKALLNTQNENGSFPARVDSKTHLADKVLQSSASSAMGTWYLEKMLLSNKVPPGEIAQYKKAIIRSLDFLKVNVLPDQRFEDFELYFSCSPKPIHYFDTSTYLYGQNTLSIQWCAEAYLNAYKLFKDTKFLKQGEYCLNILSLYQQIWNPPFINLYAFGGFGVQNTDAEWSDARQAQFAETYLNYYFITKNKEYLERAVHACRASFALMVIPQNKLICPANYQGTELNGESFPGTMAENYGHSGYNTRSYQSGFHWGTGSALTSAAILTNKLGEIYVGKDLVIGVDGIVVDKVSYTKRSMNIMTKRLGSSDIVIGVDSSLKNPTILVDNVNSGFTIKR